MVHNRVSDDRLHSMGGGEDWKRRRQRETPLQETEEIQPSVCPCLVPGAVTPVHLCSEQRAYVRVRT